MKGHATMGPFCKDKINRLFRKSKNVKNESQCRMTSLPADGRHTRWIQVLVLLNLLCSFFSENVASIKEGPIRVLFVEESVPSDVPT